MKQLLRSQSEDYHLEGVTTFADFLQRVEDDHYDVLLVDSELFNGDRESSLEGLETIGRDYPLILTISEQEEHLVDMAKNAGAFDCIIKRKGYLSALANRIKQAAEQPRSKPEPAGPAESPSFDRTASVPKAEPESAPSVEPESVPPLEPRPLSQTEPDTFSPTPGPSTAEPHTLSGPAPRPEKEPIPDQEPESKAGPPFSEQFDAGHEQAAEQQSEPDSVPVESVNGEGGYFICDRKGRFLSVNNLMTRLTRYSEAELLELTFTDLLPLDQQANFFNDILDRERLELVLIDKFGERHPVRIKRRLLRDQKDLKEIIGFRGDILVTPARAGTPPARGEDQIRQNDMITDLINIMQRSYSEPLNMVLRRMAEIVCQIFGFQRSTIALLDRRRGVFSKQAMVGFTDPDNGTVEKRAMDVPKEVIDRIFSDRFRIKVIYHTQDQRTDESYDPGVPERRTQKRRPLSEWHPRDLILLNLVDQNDKTFGYLSIDNPKQGIVPNRATFHNLELFGQLSSMMIENYYRFSTLERKNRRLKQILVNSNIFKLYLSLNELLKEVVWSVKFSLEFNLISLVLLSKKSSLLETKAVSCDDRVKMLQIRELAYDLNEFSQLLRDEYRTGKSYFVTREEKVLSHYKSIYYGVETNGRSPYGWSNWSVILVPVKSRENKIIGFLIADDPADGQNPNRETLRLLEILANQIAIAIDNRVMYIQAKEKTETVSKSDFQAPEPAKSESRPAETESASFLDEGEADFTGGGFKKLVERFLR